MFCVASLSILSLFFCRNLNDDDTFKYDLRPLFAEHGGDNLHFEMIAFNVRRASPRDVSESKICLATADPVLVDEFKCIRFEGVVLCHHNKMGVIVCYPDALECGRPMELRYHQRFVRRSHVASLSANCIVEFSIAIDPVNFAHRYHCHVATNIAVLSKRYTIPQLPVTYAETERTERGRIIVEPQGTERNGFIYNSDRNVMCKLELCGQQLCEIYRLGARVRYNEEMETGTASDVVVVDYSEQYVAGRQFEFDEKQRHDFKNVRPPSDCYTDVYIILEISEQYLSAFLNTTGGTLIFGVTNGGTVRGQPTMTRAKRDFVCSALRQRADHFKPPVPDESYNLKFEAVSDADGLSIVNTFVIIVCLLYTALFDCMTVIRWRCHHLEACAGSIL